MELLDSHEILNRRLPKQPKITRDMVAVNQGDQAPPHEKVLAEIIELHNSIAGISELEKLARKAGSHLMRKQRQKSKSEMVGTNVFIGHGRSHVWGDLKDFIKDRPAIIAWVSRQGAVVIHATKDFTVKTVQKAANLAVHAGSRLYTDSASSYRAVKDYVHEFVNHMQKEYARGDVHENRAECLFSLLKPYLRVFGGVSKFNLPGYLGFFQFLRNFRQHNACEQAELIVRAALDPTIASRARQGEFVTCFDHFDLLQTTRN